MKTAKEVAKKFLDDSFIEFEDQYSFDQCAEQLTKVLSAFRDEAVKVAIDQGPTVHQACKASYEEGRRIGRSEAIAENDAKWDAVTDQMVEESFNDGFAKGAVKALEKAANYIEESGSSMDMLEPWQKVSAAGKVRATYSVMTRRRGRIYERSAEVDSKRRNCLPTL